MFGILFTLSPSWLLQTLPCDSLHAIVTFSGAGMDGERDVILTPISFRLLLYSIEYNA